MRVTTPEFTVVEYCQQLDRGDIVVNREYQRSPEIWPTAAQAYLIDTMLLGFPIPKLTLYQKTDLASRRTIKEIVDGQQRSLAICAFFQDRLRLSRKSTFGAKRFSDLEIDDQTRFIEYPLSVDLLVATNESEIRQLFRRINSYTVPLNAAEVRHATFQGEFKWFVVELADRYSQALKDMGVFNESQLTRMADESLMAEVVLAMEQGIGTASPVRLRKLYEKYDVTYREVDSTRAAIEAALQQTISWEDLRRTSILKSYNFYALLLAVLHAQREVETLQATYRFERRPDLRSSSVLQALSKLGAAIESPDDHPGLEDFVEAGASATNTLKRRTTRFVWFCRALDGALE